MALRLHVKLLKLGRPRELKPSSNHDWYIQTDASFAEGDSVGIGAVFFDPAGKPTKFFSQRLSEHMVKALNPTCKKNAIFECEFFALFCVFLLWGDEISGAVVIYTDNNVVRDVLIACHTQCACQVDVAMRNARSNCSLGMRGYLQIQIRRMALHVCTLTVSYSWEQLLVT